MAEPASTDRAVLERHHALVAGDNAWQRRARLRQARWRERQGLDVGQHRGAPFGSRLTEADGRPPRMANYLTPTIREVVRRALADRQRGALFAEPRLWVDLLSSQPLCFNLFGELAADRDLATQVFRTWWPERIEAVESIAFEWSPGRGDLRYTGTKSAFDVFVTYRGPRGRGFVAIEVKYHEDLRGGAARNDERYRALSVSHRLASEAALPRLEAPPLQQLWFDHLLALQMLSVDADHWQEGQFVVVHPAENRHCADAVARYRELLSRQDTFDVLTLENAVDGLMSITSAPWVAALRERYLGEEVAPKAR